MGPSECETCGGAGWVMRLAKPSESGTVFTHRGPAKLVQCPSCNGDDRQQAYLESICGLEGEELGFSFQKWMNVGTRGKALEAAKWVLANHGWLTLDGRYGTGKTYLLAAIVNEARKAGRMAIYASMASLLDHLRSAFHPDSEMAFDALWNNILRAEVLCIDEAQDFNPTPWADERFKLMVVERYRCWQDTVTVVATSNVEALPGLLKSRAMDRRFRFVMLEGEDMRKSLERRGDERSNSVR